MQILFQTFKTVILENNNNNLPYFCSFPIHLIFLCLYISRNITPAISNPITRPKTMPPAKTPPSENKNKTD